MGNKLSLKSLERVVESNLSTRRYSLSDMVSESYRALYRCEDGTNLRKLAESHISDVRENPSDTDRLSHNLSVLNTLIRMNESGEVKDEDLVLAESAVERSLPEGARKLRRRECQATKKNECDITKPSLKEEIDEAEEPELTDEELEELTKHLEQIRKQRKTASVTESSEECPHCGKSPCVCEGKVLREEADDQDYRVFQLVMDVAFPASKSPSSYGLGGGGNSALFTEFSRLLVKTGLDMAGDMIDASEDVTRLYKDNGYEFFGESKDLKEGSYNYTTPETKALKKAIMGLIVDNEDERKEVVLAILKDVQEDLGESAEAKLEDNGELVDEEAHDTVEPKKLTEDEDVPPPVESEAVPPAPPQAPPVTLKDTLDTWHMLDKYQINYIEFREGEGIVVSDEEYQRLLNAVLNKGYVQSLLVLESKKVVGKIVNESKDWSSINLTEFNKKSSGKAFYKTFKKMKDILAEGTALTRQESISLYKAANSAMTHLSVELEHNPEFLGTFKESVSLLSKDVNSLLESMKRGKAPSRATMRSLASFTESLLRESEDTMTDKEMMDYWRANRYSDPVLANYKSFSDWYKDSKANGFVKNPWDDDLDESDYEDDEFIGSDEGEIQSEEADEFDQEYADARIELHKELEDEHADSEDPDVQEKLAQDVEEIVDLPGTTEEQVEELTGEEEESAEESPEEEPEVEIDVPSSEDDITDDELAELKKHLKEMRSAKKNKS